MQWVEGLKDLIKKIDLSKIWQSMKGEYCYLQLWMGKGKVSS